MTLSAPSYEAWHSLSANDSTRPLEWRTGPWLTAAGLLSFVTLVVDGLLWADSPAVRVIDFVAWATFAANCAVRIARSPASPARRTWEC
jgi:hypothetical protein